MSESRKIKDFDKKNLRRRTVDYNNNSSMEVIVGALSRMTTNTVSSRFFCDLFLKV